MSKVKSLEEIAEERARIDSAKVNAGKSARGHLMQNYRDYLKSASNSNSIIFAENNPHIIWDYYIEKMQEYCTKSVSLTPLPTW